MATSTRYFPATVMGGRLHVSGVVEWQPWDSSRLDWWDEDKLDPILAGGAYRAGRSRSDKAGVDPRIPGRHRTVPAGGSAEVTKDSM